jgi:hypothetical protein
MHHTAFVLCAENSGGWRVMYKDRACPWLVNILECAAWNNEMKARYYSPRELRLVLLI